MIVLVSVLVLLEQLVSDLKQDQVFPECGDQMLTTALT